jgi:hypothetical protein
MVGREAVRAEIDALYICHHPERLIEVDGLLAQVRTRRRAARRAAAGGC